MLQHTSASCRVHAHLSWRWAEGAGIRHGGILSPLEFLVYADNLEAEVASVSTGVQLGHDPNAQRISMLMYADDVALFAETPEQLHGILVAVEHWAVR